MFRVIDRTEDFGLGFPVWKTLLIKTKPGELEEHNQKPNDDSLPPGTALQPLVFV